MEQSNNTHLSSYLRICDIRTNPEYEVTNPAIDYNFPLDPFQKHAISAIDQEHNVLVCAKTGSGKTLVGEYQIAHSLRKGQRVFYTTPIKSLSNQKFHDLKQMFPSVGIMTGDIKFCPDAQVVIMTTEILRNLLYKRGTATENIGLTASLSIDNLGAVIFDECHYINDKDRGKIWEETMILLPRDVSLVMLSATLDQPQLFASWLGELKQKEIHLIETQYRVVPLTHYLLFEKNELKPLMNSQEIYDDKVYNDWIICRQKREKDNEDYKRKVKDARSGGVEGRIDGKVTLQNFTHQMNQTIQFLQTKEYLPALFFVLSRKDCERYASKVEGPLITPDEASSVEQIIRFHLHRYKSLDTLPQYNKLVELLKRGVAYHHSGLLPLLKEIVEILFSKGLIKVLFCTETFAVGINMPTKTVVFLGLKKYDDELGAPRVLRTDEYIQMAGRAGRRGKDKMGVVIYLPDKEPILSYEMKTMMKGNKPQIVSRMDFHYDFFLKTLQSNSLRWIDVMESSYWFQQRKRQIKEIRSDLDNLQNELSALKLIIDDDIFEQLDEKNRLEELIPTVTNSKRKDAQRKLEQWKNTHIGPKWMHYQTSYNKMKLILKEKDSLEYDLKILLKHSSGIKPIYSFLKDINYISDNKSDNNDSTSAATDLSNLSADNLTVRGIIATEINEAHPILLTELYLQNLTDSLEIEELIGLFAAFLDEKQTDDTPTFDHLEVSTNLKNILSDLQKMVSKYVQKEREHCVVNTPNNYWKISPSLIEPIIKWIQGEEISVICADYELFEGNFIRSILKISNIVDEWTAIATYMQHPQQIEKCTSIKNKLVRDIALPDSLYLRI
jgi:superfamily II RNA helicase